MLANAVGLPHRSAAMDKFDRIFQLHSILSNRRTPIDAETLQARLECSRSTLFRIIALMKDHLDAPIEFDSERGGFLYRRSGEDETYELPGLWFSPAELQSLAVMQRMLRDLGGGLLADQVSAITKRLNQLVQHRRLNLGEAAVRLRFPAVASRPAGEGFPDRCVCDIATSQAMVRVSRARQRSALRTHRVAAASHALSRSLVSRRLGR